MAAVAFEPENDLKGDAGSSDEADNREDVVEDRPRPERPRCAGNFSTIDHYSLSSEEHIGMWGTEASNRRFGRSITFQTMKISPSLRAKLIAAR